MSVITKASLGPRNVNVFTRCLLQALLLVLFSLTAFSQTISVTFNSSKGTVPAHGQGIGTAVYDGNLMDAAVPSLISNAGYNIVRYPGGSYADIYHWQTNTATGGAFVNSADTFDNFMSQVRAAGKTAIITANYGSNTAGNGGGDPNEAAEWVNYSNVTKGYAVKYWEIGNEVYGNGFYGSQWEEDLHTDKSPTAYGNNFLAYANAMKAVDSTIKVGAVLTTPNNWPDGVAPDWSSTVLPIVCPSVDFVIFHWYPSTNQLFSPENELPGIASTIRSRLTQFCPSRASSIEIWLTEGNWDGTEIPGALFAADQYPAWWENGIASMDWQILHNGIFLQNGVNEDSGVLSNASCSGATCEPAADTPFPAYYGHQMVHNFTSPGDTLLSATSSSTNVAVHAAKNSSGRLALMLINKTAGALSVPVTISGATVGATGTKFLYGQGSSSVTQSSISGLSSSFTISLPANSITDIVTTTGASTAPSITTLSPTSGTPGTAVTINGANFGATQGTSTVKFGSTTATVTSWSATSIHANVPTIAAGAVSVTVTVNSIASNGVSFTVNGTSTAPSITSLSPTSGAAGTAVTIAGANFGATQGTSTVKFGTTTATVTSWSATSIHATVPSIAAGSASVTVTVNGTASNGVAFTVTGGTTGFSCHIAYSVVQQWQGGFGTAITINNTGTTNITSWTLTFTFPSSQQITQLWNGTYTQSGAAVTINNVSYDGSIPAGGNYNGMGFNATWSGSNPAPTSFKVNGTQCN